MYGVCKIEVDNIFLELKQSHEKDRSAYCGVKHLVST